MTEAAQRKKKKCDVSYSFKGTDEEEMKDTGKNHDFKIFDTDN
jgi:hypothetical protein